MAIIVTRLSIQKSTPTHVYIFLFQIGRSEIEWEKVGCGQRKIRRRKKVWSSIFTFASVYSHESRALLGVNCQPSTSAHVRPICSCPADFRIDRFRYPLAVQFSVHHVEKCQEKDALPLRRKHPPLPTLSKCCCPEVAFISFFLDFFIRFLAPKGGYLKRLNRAPPATWIRDYHVHWISKSDYWWWI